MHENRFGLRPRAFPATPDTSCYYPATGHERALTSLREALDEQQGLALLTGEPGMGKTLLALRLLEGLSSQSISAFASNSHFPDRRALFQAILYDLSLPFEDGTEQELRLRLTDYLLQILKAGRNVVLVVDEAHHLTADLLEELRLLGNLESGAVKAIHVVLVAQKSLLDTLQQPELAALCQRLEVREQLEPLGVEEAADYLLHHLRRAGGRAEAIVSDEALDLLARQTRGVPRLLNQAARQALMLASTAEASYVDAEVVLEALAGLGIDVTEDGEEGEASNTVSMASREIEIKDSDEESIGACRLFGAPRRVL